MFVVDDFVGVDVAVVFAVVGVFVCCCCYAAVVFGAVFVGVVPVSDVVVDLCVVLFLCLFLLVVSWSRSFCCC